MAEDLSRILDLISTYTTDTDRPSNIEDPEDILNQNWYERALKLEPALKATEARSQATIGPKETGPIEDVVGEFYASNRLAPVMAAFDDVTFGIPFHDIIPNPPDKLPDGGNRMRTAAFIGSVGSSAGGMAKGITTGLDKASDIYKMYKSGELGKKAYIAKLKTQVALREGGRSLYSAIKDPKRGVARLFNTYEKWEKKNLRLGETRRVKRVKGALDRDEVMEYEQGFQFIPEGTDLGKGWDSDALITKLTPRGAKAKDQAIEELYTTLNTRKEWNKFKTTYDDLINPAQYDATSISYVNIPRTYKQYQKFLKDQLIDGMGSADEIKLSPGSTLQQIGEAGAVGRFRHSNKEIALATYLSKRDFKSVLKHELKHSLDFAVDKYRSKSYHKLEDLYDTSSSSPVLNALVQHRQRSNIVLDAYKKANPEWRTTGVPSNLFPINPSLARSLYLLKPTEVSARMSEIKSPGGLDKIRKMLGITTRPESDLLEVFDPATVERLKKTVWGGAAPFMLEDEMYEDLK